MENDQLKAYGAAIISSKEECVHMSKFRSANQAFRVEEFDPAMCDLAEIKYGIDDSKVNHTYMAAKSVEMASD